MRSPHRRIQWREMAETALIIALATLVAIKGFGAFAGVLSGLGGMIRALLRLLASGDQTTGIAWLSRPPTRIGSTRVARPVRSSVST